MAITQTLFPEFVARYFDGVVKSFTEKWNNKKKEENFLINDMTRNEYSADLTFTSASLNHSIVAADVVALNSPLPLKSRGTISKMTGVIPKVGLKFSKNEKQISDLLVMGARGAKEKEIVAKVLDDVPAAIKGVDVRNEILFEQALSSGVISVGADENTGTEIRVDFGYKAENEAKPGVAWGQTGYAPVSDIRAMFTKAETAGNTISVLVMNKKSFDLLRNSEEGKLMSANFRQLTYTASTKLPTPTRQQMVDAMEDEFACSIRIVNTNLRVEKNGQVKPATAWKSGAVIGIPQTQCGRIVYGTLVEEQRPVAGVDYSKSGDFTLVSKFAHNEPLEEFTSAQALCIPVLDDVDQIYYLFSEDAMA